MGSPKLDFGVVCMFRGLILFWLFLTCADPVLAVAWLRDQGSGFASASITLQRDDGDWSSELSYYGDYGVSQSLTFGIDLNDADRLSGHALIFARVSLDFLPPEHHLAAEISLGGAHYRDEWKPMHKLTLSYGHGFDSSWAPGWLAIDGAYEKRGTSSQPIVKLDATIGLNAEDHLRPLLQIETAKISGHRLFYSITPSLQIPLPRDSHLVIGLQHRMTTQRSLGLKVGVWHRF